MSTHDEMLYVTLGDPNGTIRHADGSPYKPFGDSYIENGKVHFDPKIRLVRAEDLAVAVDWHGSCPPGTYFTNALEGVLIRPARSIYARAVEIMDLEKEEAE